MESNRFAFLIIILIALYVLAPIDLMPGCLIDDLAAVILVFLHIATRITTYSHEKQHRTDIAGKRPILCGASIDMRRLHDE